MKKVIIILTLMIIIFPGITMAENIKNIDSEELTLKFPGSRIRIETWHNDYIKIETTYLVKNDYVVEKENGSMFFDKEKHLEKYPNDLDQSKWAIISNEVFFIIKVPKDINLSIEAASVNIKEGCKLRSLDAKFARVRGSVFMDGFVGNGDKIMIRENTFRKNVRLNYNRVIKENYRGIFWALKNILFK